MARSHRPLLASAAATALLAVALLAPSTADAFCGFYVSGADASLYNSATQVVLMRDGQRTVLTMQNNYQGPTEEFALVVPVPIVLMEDNVKVVDTDVFGKVDQLTAPRLVEYWEVDPCSEGQFNDRGGFPTADGGGNNDDGDGGVTVEAQFDVGEYNVVVLSAEEGAGLEDWLGDNDYNIPDGAAPFLDPYIQGGSYFFVAKVDPEKVTYRDGRAVLSPLRFWYDSEDFSLPIRLGMINASDVQDLLVYILAQDQRYEVANYPNVTIPTNINVREGVKDDFGSFYNALYEETLRQNEGAVVTEYSWNASTCDPCPGPTLEEVDYLTFGADVTDVQNSRNWVITRLHARYEPGQVGEDLVFSAAEPIAGGREFLQEDGTLEEGAVPYSVNNFQGRYAIRHPWEGEVDCEDPVYNRWGGPDGEMGQPTLDGAAESPNSSGGAVNRGEGVVLSSLIAEPIPELGLEPGGPGGGGTDNNGKSDSDRGGCAQAASAGDVPVALLGLVMGLGAVLALRRRW